MSIQQFFPTKPPLTSTSRSAALFFANGGAGVMAASTLEKADFPRFRGSKIKTEPGLPTNISGDVQHTSNKNLKIIYVISREISVTTL